MPRVAEEVTVNGDRLSLNLVCPTCKIAIASNGLGDIDGLGHGKRLAVVECLEPGQFVGIVFDQVGETVKQASAL